MRFSQSLLRIILLIVPILIGLVVYMFMVRHQPKPKVREIPTSVRKVRTIEVRGTDVVPRIVGFGYVRPAQVWQVISRVEGKVVYRSPDLSRGAAVKKGALLFRIHPEEYQLAVTRAENDIRGIIAQINQLDVQAENNRRLLEIEREILVLSEKEIQRYRKMLEDEMVASSVYEAQQRAYLTQKKVVQNIVNSLDLIDADRKRLVVQKDQTEVQLKNAELQLARTVIKSPASGVIAAINAEINQFVPRGKLLAEVDNLKVVQIEARFSNGNHLLSPAGDTPGILSVIGRDATLGESMGLSAVVRLAAGESDWQWPARVLRFTAALDTQTRTPGITVEVNNPEGKNSPKRPLIKGDYVEVEVVGQRLKNRLVVPRSAVHDNNRVYIADNRNQLKIRRVELEFSQGNFSVVRSGLRPGERLIVTDLVPAIEGMNLHPVEDADLARSLTAEALGGVS